jgi:chromosome segregation ATPase
MVTEMSDSSNKPSSQHVEEPKSGWRPWRSVLKRGESTPSTPDAPETREPSNADFDSFAEINEDIRDRCVSIVNRADELLALRREFIDVFTEVGKVLKESERANSALLEKTSMLALEEEQHGALKALYRTLREESESQVNEISLLRSETSRFGELVQAREARIQALEEELAVEKDRVTGLQNELEQERYMDSLTTQKLHSAHADLNADEALIADLRAQVAALSDRSSAAEFLVTALEGSLAQSQEVAKGLTDSLAESRQQAESFAQRLEEAGQQIEALGTRADKLEATLSAARLEHEVAHTVWQQKDQASNDEIARLAAQATADQSRAEASEAQLAATRAELLATASNLRAKERELEQLAPKMALIEERLETSAKEIASLTEKVAESGKSRVALADRAQALVRAMTDQKAKLELAEQRAQLLEERLASEAAQFTATIDQLESKMHVLTENFEKEKAARIVAASSLEAARSKVTRQREATSMHNSLVRAEESAHPIEDVPPLPRRAAGANDASLAQGARRRDAASGSTASKLPKIQPLVVRRESTRRSDGS